MPATFPPTAVPSDVVAATEAAAAVTLSEAFAVAMAALGPFERSPRLAVAVSGGADSVALCLLADAWARQGGGRVTALTVDHRLRPGSGGEAAQVGRWLAERGIEHHILAWSGPKPTSGVQAAARAARYRLLGEACRERGLLHLLVAHHAADQAETMLLRALAGSGLGGLAGMQPLLTLPHGRLLRPLLRIDPARLRAWLRDQQQPWIEDPSNHSPMFGRVRMRQALPSLEAAGLDRGTLAAVRVDMQAARASTDAAVAVWLAATVTCHEAGYAEIDLPSLRRLPLFIAREVLARTIATIGGGEWPPESAGIERLRDRLGGLSCGLSRPTPARESRGQEAGGQEACGQEARGPETREWGTIGRCRLQQCAWRLLVCREQRHLPSPQPVGAGVRLHWDGRFWLEISSSRTDLRVQALAGASIDTSLATASASVPKVVWPSLPALTDAAGLVEVPHLGYRRPDLAEGHGFKSVALMPHLNLSDRHSFIV